MSRNIRRVQICLVATAVVAVGIASVAAQQPILVPQVPVPPTAKPDAPSVTSGARGEEDRIPLRIELSLSRQLGEKRISNLPFTLLTSVGQNTRLRVGSNVPINAGIGSAVNVTYQSVGTNIDALVHQAGAGRYRLELRIEDSSVAEPPSPGQGAVGAPVIRSNSLNTTLILRDGQATELVVASDKVSGETIKAEVRVTEIK